MNSTRIVLTLTALVIAAPLFAQDAADAAKKPAARKALAQRADVAAPKMGTNAQPDARFIAKHEKFVTIAKEGKTDLLFLGDSITEGWGGRKDIWEKSFGAYRPANFGIGGDRTQHVLWRITSGELDGIKPKALVLMIGTNNSGSDSAEDIASGIKKIVETIREKLPATKVLLLAVFPRGEKPGAAREKLGKVNESIAKLDDEKNVHYLDIGSKFVEADGTLTKEIMPDFLHLSAKGYQIWADAITPKLAELMK
jgi:lysophospholipase L1-like esterase